MLKKINHKSITALILALALVITLIPSDAVFAGLSEVSAPAKTYSFTSNSNTGGDYCRAAISGTRLSIELRTMIPSIEFRIALYSLNPEEGFIDLGIYEPAEYCGFSSIGKRLYGFSHTLDLGSLGLSDGAYYLYISQIKNSSDKYESNPSLGALYKNMPIHIEDGMPYFPLYEDVKAENRKVRTSTGEKPSAYLDTSLEDVRFLLENPEPGNTDRNDLTDSNIAFIKRISDRVVSGSYSDYDKLLKIYEYAAGNFYYDTVAFSTHSYQYADPYLNMYCFENRVKGPNSDGNGRVATTCQGFAGIYLALARAQGIPTRLVVGRRCAPPKKNWTNEGDITASDHWWAESYVNGRWILVDPTAGTNNRWNKTTNKWNYYGITNYTYFDPSEEQAAVSHLSFRIYKNRYLGYLIDDGYETSQISSFLQIRNNGLTNGSRLNRSYAASDKKTWGDGVIDHFYGNGSGKTRKIIWNNFGLYGNVNFSDFNKLQVLELADNEITSMNLNGDSLLRIVDVSNNRLQSIDLRNCKRLTTVDTSGNELESYKIYANKRNVTVTSSGEGHIYFKYTKANRYKLRTFFQPDLCYKVEGFYRKSNHKKLTSKKSYSMNPVSSAYYVSFVPDPDSFKYELRKGVNYGGYKDYNEAAQKRLTDLGYYAGSIDGYFGSAMETAVTAFQTDYNLPVTGVLGQDSWSVLFDPDPKPVVIEPEPAPEPEPVIPQTPEKSGAAGAGTAANTAGAAAASGNTSGAAGNTSSAGANAGAVSNAAGGAGSKPDDRQNGAADSEK